MKAIAHGASPVEVHTCSKATPFSCSANVMVRVKVLKGQPTTVSPVWQRNLVRCGRAGRDGIMQQALPDASRDHTAIVL